MGQGVCLLFLIIKAANTSENDNNVQKSIFCDSQLDFWMWTYIEQPEDQNWKLELMGLAKAGKTHGSMGTGTGFDRQDAAGRVFSHVWNLIEQFLWSKPRALTGYPDQLPQVPMCSTRSSRNVGQ